MAVTKRPGEVPAMSTPLRREIRHDLRQYDRTQFSQAIAVERGNMQAEAMAELAEIAPNGVGALSPAEYKMAKRRLSVLMRRCGNPKP